jgi:hypothetical protein
MNGTVPLLAAAVLAACVTTTSEPVRIHDVDQFKVGVTMRSDAERLLGRPQVVEPAEGGCVALLWPTGAADRVAGAGARFVRLVFGPDGRLVSPGQTVYPGRPGEQFTGGPPGEARPSPVPCARDADCGERGTCFAGLCRR